MAGNYGVFFFECLQYKWFFYKLLEQKNLFYFKCNIIRLYNTPGCFN